MTIDKFERPPIGLIDGFPNQEGQWFISLWQYLQGTSKPATVQTVGVSTVTLVEETPAQFGKAFLAIGEVAVREPATTDFGAYIVRVAGRISLDGTTAAIGTPAVHTLTNIAIGAGVTIDNSGSKIRVRVTGVVTKTFEWGGTLRLTWSG